MRKEIYYMNKKIITLAMLTAIATIGTGIVAKSEPASAASRLGGISVYSACEDQYPGSYAYRVFLVENNVFGWRCSFGNAPAGGAGLDLNRQCRKQYGKPAYARYDDYNNPYSWYCSRS